MPKEESDLKAYTASRWHWNAPEEYVVHSKLTAWNYMARNLTEHLQAQQGTVIALKMEASEEKLPPYGYNKYNCPIPVSLWDTEYRVTVTFNQVVIDRSPLIFYEEPEIDYTATKPNGDIVQALAGELRQRAARNVRKRWQAVCRAYQRELQLAREGYDKKEDPDPYRFTRW